MSLPAVGDREQQYMWDLIERLFPIHRSILGPGIARVLEVISDYIPLRIRTFPTGLRCGSWTVPQEWSLEEAYVARAHRVEFETMTAGTSMYAHPIIPSLLVDEAGTVQGIRVVTDDRTNDDTRAMAYRLAVNLRNRFTAWALDCKEIPAGEGQTPVGSRFEHQICRGADQKLGQNLLRCVGPARAKDFGLRAVVDETAARNVAERHRICKYRSLVACVARFPYRYPVVQEV